MINKIIQGDCLIELKKLKEESIDCIITSPPYWGLRDYGVKGQIGLEKTIDEYLEKMLKITAELKRVLKKTGTMWWNHGDCYGGNLSAPNQPKLGKRDPYSNFPKVRARNRTPKSLCLQNFRLALAMTDQQQWILRNIIIWHKPNCMPSSVKDRFTVDFEPVFFFTKSKKYWFETQYEKTLTFDNSIRDRDNTKLNNTPGRTKMGGLKMNDYSEKNKRCVWKIPTKPFSEAHFAVFPEKLVETPIKAGCPENGIVLDPFFGAGTTGLVAQNLNRNYIGIELNPEYIKIAKQRLRQKPLL